MMKRGEYRMQTQHFTHKYTPATQWAAQSEAQFQVSSLAEAHAAIFQCFRVRLTLLSVVASCGVGSQSQHAGCLGTTAKNCSSAAKLHRTSSSLTRTWPCLEGKACEHLPFALDFVVTVRLDA